MLRDVNQNKKESVTSMLQHIKRLGGVIVVLRTGSIREQFKLTSKK